jgi:hypothetical protein
MRLLSLDACRDHAVQIAALVLVTVAALTVTVCSSPDGTGLRTEGNADRGDKRQTVTVDPVRSSLVGDTVRLMDR